MSARVMAVFGGSFNPPHLAHVLAVTCVLSLHQVDGLLVVPTFRHPFAKPLAPFDERVRMCELAMGWLPKVEVSRVEETLGGESRTLRTLEHLASAHPSWQLRLVVGADILLEAHKWYGFERIQEIAPLLVLGRVGVAHPRAPVAHLPGISSTDVRADLAAGQFEKLADVLPRDVLAHIRARGLYRDA